MKYMLLKTRNAKLTHHVRGGPLEIFMSVMEIRKKFNTPL
jgi:hypothetical protein